jgi:chromate transporter
MAAKLWELFSTFVKISLMTFSGYALLPIAQRELIERKRWIDTEELADYYAIAQATPGMIAVNTATFCGKKVAGNLGGVVATLGFVAPSVVLVAVAAGVLGQFMDVPAVQSAFAGIRVAVCVLIFNTVVKLWKVSVRDALGASVFAVALAATLLFDASPVLVVVGAALLGAGVQGVRELHGHGEGNGGCA